MSQIHSRKSSLQGSPLQGIFGPNAAEWNYSEQTLREALEVKRQQEITKQEYYKAENSTRVLELLKVAINSQLSESTIALMFNFMTVKGGVPETGNYQEELPKREDPFIRKPVATHSKTKSLNTIDLSVIEQANGISQYSSLKNAPPMGCFKTQQKPIRKSKFASAFKFGGSSAHSSPPHVKIPTAPQPRKTLLSPRHQLSPARIGAHAVCSLGADNGSIKPARVSTLRHGEGHLRSLSLPTNVTIPESTCGQRPGAGKRVELCRRNLKKRRFDLSGLGIKYAPDVRIRDANLQVVDESGDTTIDESVNDSLNEVTICEQDIS
ncbi:hypothetical protein HII13_003568 [Brettanomyces bruxellensis]|uniref:Uncharacterized protein n=1 Tax=Dekkera bruxellensis TaxID=5007 RepID=A0A8H6ET81_DEKBR|nr:uncharacterized protein BRETT_005084 [Brettanomyces bruxellensis]KAF6009489.1 hypothetical protein HII13_003568 [Brettanomyces bruxellensis]QOU20427.1 hypothetical protein BRETT_005084 [Brettanomyces bruxellensis]